MAPYRTHFDYCDKKFPQYDCVAEEQDVEASLRDLSVTTN